MCFGTSYGHAHYFIAVDPQITKLAFIEDANPDPLHLAATRPSPRAGEQPMLLVRVVSCLEAAALGSPDEAREAFAKEEDVSAVAPNSFQAIPNARLMSRGFGV